MATEPKDRGTIELEAGVRLLLRRTGERVSLRVGDLDEVELTLPEARLLAELLDELSTRR